MPQAATAGDQIPVAFTITAGTDNDPSLVNFAPGDGVQVVPFSLIQTLDCTP